jgi:UDP-3-O-[3-hydroxymyristoyl] glucosamine N-acyltransferase
VATKPVRLAELAVRFGCELRGDPDLAVDHVATLKDAGPGAIAFLANPRYRRHLTQTRATAVILQPAHAADCPVPALLHRNPYATYARIAQLLHPGTPPAPGVHPSAVIASAARIDASASVAAQAVIEADCVIGPGCHVGPGCFLLGDVVLGAGTKLVARVTLGRGVRMGERCIVHPGAVIGADGFGHAPDVDGYVKVPQLGAVWIGDDVEIGANSTIDRGAIDDTVIGSGVKIDNLVQIGHNVRIGEHTVIAGCVGISGSTTIGRRCMIGGMVGMAGHLEVCDDVVLTGRTSVLSSITEPGVYSGGMDADGAARFRRNSVRFRQLDQLAQRIKALERKAKATTEQHGHDDD